jgi:alpha-galactosidase
VINAKIKALFSWQITKLFPKLIRMKRTLLSIGIAIFSQLIIAQQKLNFWDSLALTPPMGWNSWNFFENRVSEKVVKDMADAMSTNGMNEAGYKYLIIDDFWVGGRDAKNRLFPDSMRFPNGMKHLADYVHSKGLKLGIYSDAAPYTCGGVTASYGFEELDAKTFVEWGIDYLKYDYCNAPEDVVTAFTRYSKMGNALKNSGRPIVFAICEWGQRKPWLWARAAGGHLWRTTWDSRDVWQSNDKNLTGIMEIYEQQQGLESFAGPGGWNDPDLLMVGLNGKGSSSTVGGRFKGCTFNEYRTHFALWCMLAAPLIVNMDLSTMDKPTLDLLTNKYLVAINQDPLGKQASIVYDKDNIQVLVKPMSNNQIAVCVFNKNDMTKHFRIDLKNDLNIWQSVRTTQIWSARAIPKLTFLEGQLPAHDCEVYLLEY